MAQRLRKQTFLILFTVFRIILIECEEVVFRIRKCCAENELILEKTSECVDFKLLRMSNHFYHHDNDTETNLQKEGLGGKNSRPWWFPPNKKIISKKTNETLKSFPKKMEVVSGEGQPCDILETAFLPIYMSQYDFYDDGSIVVYPNQSDGFHTQKVEIIFDAMSYCLDRLELDTDNADEATQPTLDFSDTIDYLIMLCPCKKATCVLKCCPPGMLIDVENAFDRENACVRSEPEKDWAPNYTKVESDSKDYFLLHRFPICKPGEGTVIPNQFKMDGHTIFSNGSAHIYGETHFSQSLEFCGENFITGQGARKIYNHLIRCYPESGIKNRDSEIRRILYGVLFVFGSIFLFLTLLVHGLLPTRNNIHDKNLISQTWSLLIGYVCIAISQLAINDLPQSACIFLGFLIQYSFLAAFFWLNVLCFDISWTFSELKIVRGIPNERSHRKFFYYSIYCWISPAVISIITAIIEFLPSIPEHLIRPQIKERCWFRNDSDQVYINLHNGHMIFPWIGHIRSLFKFNSSSKTRQPDLKSHNSVAILAYFYGPIAVLLSMNILMFLYTLYKIYQAQKDISTIIKNSNPEKQRFILYMKLLVLMGLPWIAELISWVVGGPNYYWYLTDIINLLRAVFIFSIFCCKKQVLDELRRKFGFIKKPSIRRPSIPRTSSSFIASTHSQELPKFTNNAVSSL